MDPDPGGPKTCGSGGSGFGSATTQKGIYFQPEGGLQIQIDDVLWPRLGLWQPSVHHQLKSQAHIGHLLVKNLRMSGE